MYDTIEERKQLLTKGIDKPNFRDSSELTLQIEGKFTNLRIWVGNEKSLAEGGGKKLVYMRLDKCNDYSVTWNEEHFNYLQNPPKEMTKLLKFGFTSELSDLDEILEITKKMKYRQLIQW